MLAGKTGNGKTLIADLLANAIGGDLYRSNCAAEAEVNASIENLKRHIVVRSLDAPHDFGRSTSTLAGVSFFL